MPLGPYKDWKSCISAQVKRGKSKESAAKICGFLEKQSKGLLTQKDINEIEDETSNSEIKLAKASIWFESLLNV